MKKDMKPTSPKEIFKSNLSSSYIFAQLSASLIMISREKFTWNKTDKTPTFTGIPPHVTFLTMLEAIRESQEGVVDEVSGNIIAELSKRGTFGGFSEERMQ